MGLTKKATGNSVIFNDFSKFKKNPHDITVCLSGNPNVGKSTVFNALTGMHQHTGNWSGKTVDTAIGTFEHCGRKIILIDTPGTYSLIPASAEEKVARDFIINGKAEVNVIVCDSTALERNLNLVLQILQNFKNTVLCLNFSDEAKTKGININLKKLSYLLGIPVVSVSAQKKLGLNELKNEIIKLTDVGNLCVLKNEVINFGNINASAEKIYSQCVTCTKYKNRNKKADKILTGKITAFPIMFILLLIIFWITIKGANYPSEILSNILFSVEAEIFDFLQNVGMPIALNELLIHGIFRVVAWIISVMLPPMAIFFPLFTLLEDSGYLPRIAFCLDRCFKKCKSCGKQALTMCMGFGCNAAGVVGCRIINSPRERLIAILTNCLIPCNGRFPLLINIITMFFVTGIGGSFIQALILSAFIILGILTTLLMSYLLSKTVLRGMNSTFILELPPYRKPQIGKIIVRSVFDRTVFVLWRAIISAIPAGLIIWFMANITLGNTSLLSICSDFLNPFARIMGLDGVILLAFILGMPANEIVIPIIIMGYLGNTTLSGAFNIAFLKEVFIENGWTLLTAFNVMLFSMFHWPCTTTLITIKKETGSIKWTVLGFILPTVIGIIFCILTTLIYKLFI